ncbi:MAG: Cell shape-determining protein MreC precursor [Candidatus Dependentiae bacterium ADurb.Bin331]|nr:MAG: Cell shape-determining protein MreC precursor [Candidatus Dependentiae bacterium ADurb.Bin331]
MSIRARLGVLLVGVGIVLFFWRTEIPYVPVQLLDTGVSMIVYPFVYLQNAITRPVRSLVQQQWSIAQLQEQVRHLQNEREELVARSVMLESSLRFVNDVQPLIEFQKRYTPHNAQMVQIILHHFGDDEHFVLIDAGSRKGVAPGMVALYQNNLIGRVDQVFPFYSKVALITDRRCKVAVWCGSGQARGIYEGMNRHDVGALAHMSHLQEVKLNDFVISSGEGTVFPHGFALGKVVFCACDGVYQNVKIEPLLDLRKLDYCLLVQKGQ